MLNCQVQQLEALNQLAFDCIQLEMRKASTKPAIKKFCTFVELRTEVHSIQGAAGRYEQHNVCDCLSWRFTLTNEFFCHQDSLIGCHITILDKFRIVKNVSRLSHYSQCEWVTYTIVKLSNCRHMLFVQELWEIVPICKHALQDIWIGSSNTGWTGGEKTGEQNNEVDLDIKVKISMLCTYLISVNAVVIKTFDISQCEVSLWS